MDIAHGYQVAQRAQNAADAAALAGTIYLPNDLPTAQSTALAVAATLTRDGVAANRVTTVGRGADDPVASNDTDDGRAKNRRIEIHVK